MTTDDTNATDLAAARERYKAEREKRLRTDGIAQYREFTGDLNDGFR